MSSFNPLWLKSNFGNRDDVVFFDVGCGNMGDTVMFQQALPNATFHAFECSQAWKEKNLNMEPRPGITYVHAAVSDVDGTVTFYPSDRLNNVDWWWSGSVFRPNDKVNMHGKWEWGEPYTVPSITLESYCEKAGVSPTIIHIDVQGAEVRVLSKLGKHRPQCIWAEVTEFTTYDTGNVYEDLQKLLISMDYVRQIRHHCDELWVHRSANLSKYYV